MGTLAGPMLWGGGILWRGGVDGGDTPLTDPLTLVSCRTGEAWRSDRLMLNKEVLSPQVVEGFVPLLSEVGEDFVRRARAQVGKSGRESWTADFTHELFRFALECECQGHESLQDMSPPKHPFAWCPRWATRCVSPSFILRDGQTSFSPKAVGSRGMSSLQTSREQLNAVDKTLFYHLPVINW